MINGKKVLALMPLKDHSERVKEKNFRDFCGKPLYHHVLHTLEHTSAVDEVLINTDSARVMEEAPKLFAKVKTIERPSELCGDFVAMNDIIKHDLERFPADLYLQTHATNPLVRPETFTAALKLFVETTEHDSVFSVTPRQCRFYTGDSEPVNHDPAVLLRTQDLTPLYEENSVLYVFTRESFAKHNHRIGAKPLMYKMQTVEAVDIDDEFAFRLAELLRMYAGA